MAILLKFWLDQSVQAQLKFHYDFYNLLKIEPRKVDYRSLFHLGAAFYTEILELALNSEEASSVDIGYGWSDHINYTGPQLQPNGDITNPSLPDRAMSSISVLS